MCIRSWPPFFAEWPLPRPRSLWADGIQGCRRPEPLRVLWNASKMVTSWPLSSRSPATVSPEGPEPMTATFFPGFLSATAGTPPAPLFFVHTSAANRSRYPMATGTVLFAHDALCRSHCSSLGADPAALPPAGRFFPRALAVAPEKSPSANTLDKIRDEHGHRASVTCRPVFCTGGTFWPRSSPSLRLVPRGNFLKISPSDIRVLLAAFSPGLFFFFFCHLFLRTTRRLRCGHELLFSKVFMLVFSSSRYDARRLASSSKSTLWPSNSGPSTHANLVCSAYGHPDSTRTVPVPSTMMGFRLTKVLTFCFFGDKAAEFHHRNRADGDGQIDLVFFQDFFEYVGDKSVVPVRTRHPCRYENDRTRHAFFLP